MTMRFGKLDSRFLHPSDVDEMLKGILDKHHDTDLSGLDAVRCYRKGTLRQHAVVFV